MNKVNRQPRGRLIRLHQQAGSIIITVCLMLLFLLGFMGIALDLSHLFVVKTELQTAMDSCALAAAQELDQQPGARARARSAGVTAGNLNGVNFQASQWELGNEHITFKDQNYTSTEVDEMARYVECAYSETGVRMWLLHILGAVENDVPGNPTTRDVFAKAVASRGSALTACPIPVALIPKEAGTAPHYGYEVGEWIPVIDADNGDNIYAEPGEMGWFNIDGTSGAKDTKDQLSAQGGGVCGTVVNEEVELGTRGFKGGVRDQWNYRFGLSKGAERSDAELALDPPDLSGYAYDPTSWPDRFGAFDDFANVKRPANEPHQDSSWKNLTRGQHAQYGYNRRVVTVPVLSSTSKVIDYACMFMLMPMFTPQKTVYVEFLGNAGDPNSPCTTNGIAGALAGPLVPVLVR